MPGTASVRGCCRRCRKGGWPGCRPAPAEATTRATSKTGTTVSWRGGSGRRGRCKYVHVSSVAASMRLTPPANPPSRPRTISCAPREDQKKKSKAKAGSSGIRVDQGRHLPERNAVTTDRGNLSKAGWVRLRGREPRGCGDRAYMDVLAASPSTGPTRQPTECRLLPLTLTLIRRVQGCKPCRNPTPLSRPQPPQCGDAPATPAAGPMPPAGHRPPESRHSPGPS